MPGLLARSVFMAADGLALGQFGSYDTDDRTPFRRRWGGWYVTGSDGGIAHIGNAIVTEREKREAIVSDSALHRIAAGDGVRRADLPVGAERHRRAHGVLSTRAT